jgi:hypothetical protein
LKGMHRDLPLRAEVVPQQDDQLKARVLCDLDRTHWGVLYGSGRFYDKLGMHLVNEIITAELFLVAKLLRT